MGGISSIIGAIALLGFLVFLAGVGMVVVSASQGRPVRGGILLAIIGLVFGVLLSVVSQGVIVVEPQERAVVFETLSGNLGDPRGPGTHIIIPVLQEAKVYQVRQQEYTMSGDPNEGAQIGDDAVVARTSDGQEVRLDVTVLFNIDPAQVNLVHTRWEDDYLARFVRPTVRNLVRNEVSLYSAEELYGTERTEMETSTETSIREAFQLEGLQLTGFLVRAINFTPEFSAAIEEKEIERQKLQRAQTEAERVRTEAQGRADAAIEQARGESEAAILRAEAQAEALRLVSEQLASNPLLIQYEYIRNLSDNINLALIPSNSPFLFDYESLTNLPQSTSPTTQPQSSATEEPADSGQ